MARTEKQSTARLPIGRILLIAFVAMPLIEIAVLIQVGSWLGLWPTLGLIVLTAVIGTWMLRRQGFAVMARAQQQLADGGIPLGEVFEGFCLVVAGALLLTPGFVTDFIGGSLLMPPVRAWLYRVLGGRFREAAMPGRHPAGKGPTVDGDYTTVDPQAERSGPKVDPLDPGASELNSETEQNPKVMPPPRGGWDEKS